MLHGFGNTRETKRKILLEDVEKWLYDETQTAAQLTQEENLAQQYHLKLTEKHAHEQNAAALKNHLHELHKQQYLNDLNEAPLDARNHLEGDVLRFFRQYDETYPIGQPAEIRYFLIFTCGIINAIKAQRALTREEGKLQYYQLIGLIVSLKERVHGLAMRFEEGLQSILDAHPLDEKQCVSQYNLFCMHDPIQYALFFNPRTLHEIEQHHFHVAIQRLQDYLHDHPLSQDLKHKGRRMLHAIDQLEQERKSMFDYKFHTLLIEAAVNWLSDLPAQEKQQRFQCLAEHSQAGKPSLHKRIAGAVIAFIGAAIVAACAIAQLVIPVFSLPITIGGGVSGVALCASGATLFKRGYDTGVRKKSLTFAYQASPNKPR